MKLIENMPPRAFTVGCKGREIRLKDCAHIWLEPNEQITMQTENGAEYDIVKKEWGYYATPSINGRLLRFGWKTALIKNAAGQIFIWLVESGKDDAFHDYLVKTDQKVVIWLSDADTLEKVEELSNNA